MSGSMTSSEHCHEEGWCLEYDGADLGYLSATVSFLAKLRKLYTDERIERVCARAIDFCSHFVFPDGHYGGSLGSRQTLHFYPHGFELFAPENPTAAAVAEAMLRALWARAAGAARDPGGSLLPLPHP